MTREQTKALLPVLVAWSEGRDVQFKTSDGEWITFIVDSWSVSDQEWRVKPTPREFWVVVSRMTGEVCSAFSYPPDGVNNDLYEIIPAHT